MIIKIDEITSKAKEIISSPYDREVPDVETKVTYGHYYSFVRIYLHNITTLSYSQIKKFQACFAKNNIYSINVTRIPCRADDSDGLEVYIEINGLKPKFVDYEH